MVIFHRLSCVTSVCLLLQPSEVHALLWGFTLKCVDIKLQRSGILRPNMYSLQKNPNKDKLKPSDRITFPWTTDWHSSDSDMSVRISILSFTHKTRSIWLVCSEYLVVFICHENTALVKLLLIKLIKQQGFTFLLSQLKPMQFYFWFYCCCCSHELWDKINSKSFL